MCDLTEKLEARNSQIEGLEAANSLLENKLVQAENTEKSLNSNLQSMLNKLEVLFAQSFAVYTLTFL